MYNSKINADEKLKTVKDILSGKEALPHAATRLSVHASSVEKWINSYEGNGIDAFLHSSANHYSRELKLQAVTAYLNNEESVKDICKRFGLRSRTQLWNWVKKYNGHGELKASGTGGSSIMTKGKTTTFDERVEIAAYCITHEHNYSATADKYGVSYQQARSFTLKFEAGGIDALQDNRGKKKSGDSLTEVEKLRAELRIEKALRKKAEMEADFLKKLEEIERRRG